MAEEKKTAPEAEEEFITEERLKKAEAFILRGVRTQSPAVAGYYGFEEGRTFYPVNRKMDSFVIRLGMTHAQILFHGNQKISLAELGERGDRLEVRVRRMPWGRYLLSSGKKERG